MITQKSHPRPDFSTLKRGLQRFQSDRLNRTYADLKADPQYAAIGDFFFNRLYAPEDFTFRDTSIKTLQQALEGKIYRPIASSMIKVVELHELSDRLDDQMVEKMIENHLDPRLTMDQYKMIYRQTDVDQRVYQIKMAGDTTRSFYHLSRKWVVAISLKTINVASHFLNIGDIMDFINEGYTAFRKIRNIDYFIDTISRREMDWHHFLLHEPKNIDRRIT
jgi:hypothetical protein